MANPEDRYVKLEIKTLSNGRRVYKSSRPISVPVNEASDITIYAGDADRMDVIAKNVYGSALDWWKIAAANKHVNGSLHIAPGTKIIIPRR